MKSLRYPIGMVLCLALGISYSAAQATAPAAGKIATKRPAASTQTHHRTAAKAKKQQEPPPPPQPPPPPPQPKDLPAVAPRVTYQGGLLTIVAPNSNLGDVLRAVSARTGARVDIPAAAQNQRVVANLGPAAPAAVLGELLDGSPFDYVVLESATRPGALDRIVLTPAGPAPTNTNAAAQPPQSAPPAAQEAEGDEGAPPEEAPESAQPEPEPPEQPEQQAQPQPGQPQPAQPQPNQNPEQQQQQAPEQGQPNSEQQNPQQPKTPEQLLQELQRMQQQQQQQQQQQETPK